VIGCGQLLADKSMAEFIAHFFRTDSAACPAATMHARLRPSTALKCMVVGGAAAIAGGGDENNTTLKCLVVETCTFFCAGCHNHLP
jgi:hypothetical protein